MKDKVLKMLGVDIGEEFFLKDVAHGDISSCRYRFNRFLYLEKLNEGSWGMTSLEISDIITGIYAIVKIPASCEVYKAKDHDKCFSISFSREKAYVNESLFEERDYYDLSKYAFGMVFKTRKEADIIKNIIIDKIKESYNKGIPLIDWNKFITKKEEC